MGGNRYIGLNLVFELARQGHDVTVMNSHEAPMPDGARRLHGDRQVPGTHHRGARPAPRRLRRRVRQHGVPRRGPRADGRAVRRPGAALRRSPAPSAVYRRTFVQPVLETFRTPRSARRGAGEGLRRRQGAVRAVPRRACYQEHGFPYTSFRVSHTIGPRSPLPTREPIYFERLTQGRPDPHPRRGLPVRQSRPRRRRGVADGVDHRQRRRRRARSTTCRTRSTRASSAACG